MLFLKKPAAVSFPDEVMGLPVKISRRARYMALRAEAVPGGVMLVVPEKISKRKNAVLRATEFVQENAAWIKKQREKQVPVRLLAPGQMLTVFGRNFRLVHQAGRGLSSFAGDDIIIRGGADHFSRRLRDFLKKEAAIYLKNLSDEKAKILGLPPVQVRAIDPKTRWGSCAPDGRLMYSWRLILAPPAVADYVVAHEVAHRIHHNHSKKFWALCASLTETEVSVARDWLYNEGVAVMLYR